MTINIKTDGHILLIEIDRPKKYNAMTQEIRNSLRTIPPIAQPIVVVTTKITTALATQTQTVN